VPGAATFDTEQLMRARSSGSVLARERNWSGIYASEAYRGFAIAAWVFYGGRDQFGRRVGKPVGFAPLEVVSKRRIRVDDTSRSNS